MTRLAWTLCLLLGVLGLRGQSIADPVAIRVGERDVALSEFVYSMEEAGIAPNKVTVGTYVPDYVNNLLMIQGARDAKMDTTSRFRRTQNFVRRQLLTDALADSVAIETSLRNYYNYWAKTYGKDGVIRLSHIFIPLSQTATSTEQQAASSRVDSIYKAIKGGTPFEMLVQRYAIRGNSLLLNGASETWLGRGETFEEFEEKAFSLAVGEVSTPFLSTVGYHIVKVLEKKDLMTYEDAREEMTQSVSFMAAMRKRALALVLNQRERSAGEQTFAEQQEKRLMEDNLSYAYKLRKSADELLLADYVRTEISGKIPQDDNAFQTYLDTDASARKKMNQLSKKLKKKKARNIYEEAKRQVLSDYQTALETRLLADLRAQYKVVVYQDVIKTVYKH